MSDEHKPLIFLAPINDSLKELREEIEKTAEEEKIDIYDVDSLDELNQLNT